MMSFKVIKYILLFICGFAAFSLITVGEAISATYYIAPATATPPGNDSNTGSISSPWATLSKANATIAAGDTVFMRGGIYSGTGNKDVIWRVSGTVGNVITIKAYAGETPIINSVNASNAALWIGYQSSSVSYIVIDGLEFTNQNASGVAILIKNADHITIKNCNIHDHGTVSGGAVNLNTTTAGQSQDTIIIENNTFSSNGRTEYDHHIYVAANNTNVTIRNNIFKDGTGAGVNIYDSTYNSLNTGNIYNNIFDSNYWGVVISKAQNINVYNNTFYNNTYSSIYMEGDPVTNVVIKNNISHTSVGYGIKVKTSNTIAVTEDYNFWYDISGKPICWNSSSGICGNTYTVAEFRAATTNSDHSIEADPLFVNASGGDFHITQSSPAINKGANIGIVTTDYDNTIRPQGGSFDIGAYEYVSSIGDNDISPAPGVPTVDSTPPAPPMALVIQ